eukprot:PITA_27583
MGYLYKAMDRAKESIRAYYDDNEDEGFQKQLFLWEVIDERWNNTLHCLIHAARIYLNPSFSYPCGFVFNAEIMDGFLTCVKRMVQSPAERAEISKEMEIYKMPGGTFGFKMVVTDRTTKMPGVPHLQKFAIRILSQTCSSSGCERNWSVFEKIHNKKRNRLESHRLNDMVYVYYNLQLWVKQLEKIPNMKAISLDGIDTTVAWRVEVERPLMESSNDWLEQEVVEGVEGGEEDVTPPTWATPATNRGRGLPPLAPTSSGSRAQQSPLPTPPASTSRGKENAIAFSRKKSKGNQ